MKPIYAYIALAILWFAALPWAMKAVLAYFEYAAQVLDK
jgi:hypothetical protein